VRLRKYALALGSVAAAVTLMGASSCDSGEGSKDPRDGVNRKIEQQNESRTPYVPHNDVEFKNFNRAQELYDSPTTVIWCTTTWGNPSAPIVTIPIAGKLTSSSVSYLPQQRQVDHGNYSWSVLDAPSNDGMYHGNPAPYRYGFTPGGQYNDFFNMPTLCTTSLTKFQREQTFVSTQLDSKAASIDQRAQTALRERIRSRRKRSSMSWRVIDERPA
jgi:hypothetical protein